MPKATPQIGFKSATSGKQVMQKYPNIKIMYLDIISFYLTGFRFLSVCLQPKVTGPCEALFRRYYYNSAAGLCEEFIYGGCQGNDNNFQTLAECEHRCTL